MTVTEIAAGSAAGQVRSGADRGRLAGLDITRPDADGPHPEDHRPRLVRPREIADDYVVMNNPHFDQHTSDAHSGAPRPEEITAADAGRQSPAESPSGGRRLALSRGAAIRVLVALVVAGGFLTIARSIDPGRGLATEGPTGSVSTPPAQLPPAAPDRDGADSAATSAAKERPSLGRLEGAQFDVEILGGSDDLRYNVHHKSGALLLREATSEQVERNFPDLDLDQLRSSNRLMLADDVRPY